ncbi:MAG: hypothetical protein ACFE0P_06195 [Oceanicaulis sp.]
MTQQQAYTGAGLMNGVRAVLAGVIAVAVVGLVFVLAAFLTMAALVAAGVAALGASAYWLYRKVRGRKSGETPMVLVARRGPQGWTVDGDQARGA